MPQYSETKNRVIIIDDHAMVGTGFQMILEECGDFKIVGLAHNVPNALQVVQHNECEVILLDLDIGGQDGSQLITPLLSLQPQAQILILAGQNEMGAAHQVATLGARGILLKEHSAQTLIKAVDCVQRGELWMDRSLVANLITDLQRGPAPKSDPHALKMALLTAREREVIALLGEGLKNKEIARRLFLSETTVRHHLTSIFAKLEVTDRLELVIYAYRHALIEPVYPSK